MRNVAKPSKPPTVEITPASDDLAAGQEAVSIAELAGLDLDDWQVFVLLVGLARRKGLWAAFEVALIVARQNGKSEILIAVILWALFTEIDDPRLVIFAAHEYKTAREIFLRLRSVLDPPAGVDPLWRADDWLVSQVKSIRTANGEESVELHNGRRVRFLARTSGSGRGFTGDLVLLDEAYRLNQEQMSALLPTMGARPNPQIWYASMGPFEDSEVQIDLMERARSDDPGNLCYLGWEAPLDVSVDDRDWWARCNPAHPHRMSMATLANEFKALGDLGFAREKLCTKVSVSAPAIPPELWAPAQDASASPSGDLAFGFELGSDRDFYSVVASDGRTVELVEYGAFTSSTVDQVADLVERHDGSVGIAKHSPAGSLIDRFPDRKVVEYSNRELGDACGRFYDLFPDEIRVRERPEFDRAAAGAVRKQTGDSWVWSRRSSHVDITPLLGAVLAVDAARNGRPARSAYEDGGELMVL